MATRSGERNVGTARLLVRTFRIRQWVKSGFILAPALFTLRILDSAIWWKLAVGVVGFSLVASAIYALNDVLNRDEDRHHPVKRMRPVASGELGIGSALGAALVLLGAGEFLLYLAVPRAALMGGGYAILMVAYCLFLRRLLIVDLLVVASGFVLRVLTGAVLIEEPVSHWLLLCTFTIALFLGLIKRRQEIATLEENGSKQSRAVLVNYPSVSILDGWITVVMAMTLICYSLYTVDAETIAKHHTDALIYTVPFALYGIFRYQKLAISGRAGEDPTDLVIKDVGIKLVVVLWAVMVGVILWTAKRG